MKNILLVISVLLVSLGFMAEFIQVDKLSDTELVLKENSKADESNIKEKNEREDGEKINLFEEPGMLTFFSGTIDTHYKTSCHQGFISILYTPPDLTSSEIIV